MTAPEAHPFGPEADLSCGPGVATAFHWSFPGNTECFSSVTEDRMRRLIIAVILILAATAVFATARQDTKSAAPMMPRMMGNADQMRSMMQNSPMNIPGVEVAVTDTPDGRSEEHTSEL